MGMHVFMENIMSVHVQPPYFCWLRGWASDPDSLYTLSV